MDLAFFNSFEVTKWFEEIIIISLDSSYFAIKVQFYVLENDLVSTLMKYFIFHHHLPLLNLMTILILTFKCSICTLYGQITSELNLMWPHVRPYEKGIPKLLVKPIHTCTYTHT